MNRDALALLDPGGAHSFSIKAVAALAEGLKVLTGQQRPFHSSFAEVCQAPSIAHKVFLQQLFQACSRSRAWASSASQPARVSPARLDAPGVLC